MQCTIKWCVISFERTLCVLTFSTNPFCILSQRTNARKRSELLAKQCFFFFLRKVHQKMAEHLSHLSPKQYELYLEILFIVFVLGENRELSPKKSNRFSSLSLDMTFDTWKHHWGACFHLSSISYLLSLPVSHWKVFCVCVVKGFFHSFPCYAMSLSFTFMARMRLFESTRPCCLGISALHSFDLQLLSFKSILKYFFCNSTE